MSGKNKKVMVSGCYDLLHGGHIAFFKTAAQFGELYVMIGSDENILGLKGKAPYFKQEERKFMVGAIRYVHKAIISSGSGMLDFEPDMEAIKPDIFVVNQDGHTAEKEKLCRNLGVEYKVLERIPEPGLPARSSSSTKKEMQFPYRICIAGGWMDQPWVSKIHPGSVTVAQIWPTIEFNDRSGMATSSRKVALELWSGKVPEGDQVRNAQLLFGAENPPFVQYVSGSQDQIGLMVPGVSNLYYNGGYWPEKIDNCLDEDICNWLSNVLNLVPLKPRPTGFDPIAIKNLTKRAVQRLGDAGTQCYESIINKNIKGLGESMTETFLTWKEILPNTVPDWVMEEMETKYLSKFHGAITSGSGGGYVIVASDTVVDGAIKIRVKY